MSRPVCVIEHLVTLAVVALLSACDGEKSKDSEAGASAAVTPALAGDTVTPAPASGTPFAVATVAQFDAPWAMTFLPDQRLLVTEMAGVLRIYDPVSNRTGVIRGVPEVVHAGQGGLSDVVLHPDFATNQIVYISYVEAGEGGAGAAVARARLTLDDTWRRRARESRSHLASDAEEARRRPLRPAHRVRPRRHAVDQLQRAQGVRSRAGHGHEPRQDRASQTTTAACPPTIRSRTGAE